jgi:hypothetical protein
MAAQYTEISGQEMEVFLKRAFRALRPTQGMQNKEIYYDLKLSPQVVIRVWTSIRPWGASAGVGEDAIRVQLLGVRVNRPLVSGKAPIVKRTQGWRNSLQDKIEEYLELYEEKSAYFDGVGGAEPGSKGPSASDKQVKFILSMGSKAEEAQWDDTGLSWPVDEQEVKNLTSKEASKVIEALLGHGLGRRYSSEELADVGVRSILRREVMRSLQADSIQERIACEGGCSGDCDKSECTCGGVCTCGKKATALVSAQVPPNPRQTHYEDPVIASILDDLLV